MAGQHVVTITDATFKSEVLDSKVPVLVDFWATWCGPCRAIAPLIDQLGDEYAGRAKVGKVDVDSNMAIASQFQISSIPTLMVFKNGQVVEHVIGGRPKAALAAILDKHL